MNKRELKLLKKIMIQYKVAMTIFICVLFCKYSIN